MLSKTSVMAERTIMSQHTKDAFEFLDQAQQRVEAQNLDSALGDIISAVKYFGLAIEDLEKGRPGGSKPRGFQVIHKNPDA
jgi:hypothetical protein